MTLKEYQERAMSTCTESSRNLGYMLTNLNSEVGELNGKFAKAIRKKQIKIDGNEMIYLDTKRDPELDNAIALEMGDCLWQIVCLCVVMGYSLEEIAQMNLDKLQARKQANTIVGDGDGIIR